MSVRSRNRKILLVFGLALCGLIVLTALHSPVGRAKSGTHSELQPTRELPGLVAYLTDIWLIPASPRNLLESYPALIDIVPEAASGTYRQIGFEIPPGVPCADLSISWRSEQELAYVLFDRLGAPIHSAHGRSGAAALHVRNSLYALKLFYSGTIPKGSFLRVTATPAEDCPPDTLGAEAAAVEVPTLRLDFAPGMYERFDTLRAHYLEGLKALGSNGSPVKTLNKPVVGYIRSGIAGASSVVGITSAGVGDVRHFDPLTPSFTVKVVSGPAILGTSRFKLYGIPTKGGLLDYVAEALAAREGILMPRSRLVRLTIEGRVAGLYVLEETPSPEFFWGLRRHPSTETTLGKVYFKGDNAQVDQLASIYPDLVAREAEPVLFARSIAFMTRFNATHGLCGDFRLIRDEVLGEFEPVLRDINVNQWVEDGLGVRSLLSHGSWWLGSRFYGFGPHLNPKLIVNPMKDLSEPSISYRETEDTVGFDGVHPVISEFVKDPRRRALFERYLAYYSSRAFLDDYQEKLATTFQAVQRFADSQAQRQFLLDQVQAPFAQGDAVVPRHLGALAAKARVVLLADAAVGERFRYRLYNFSPFTLELAASSPYAALAEGNCRDGFQREGLYLGPSPLFPMLVNGLYDMAPGRAEGRLTQRVLRSAVNLEIANAGGCGGTSPVATFLVAPGNDAAFRASIQAASGMRASGVFPLEPAQVLLAESRPADGIEDYVPLTLPKSPEQLSGREPKPIQHALIFQELAQRPTERGYQLRYIVVNQTNAPATLDLKREVGKFFPSVGREPLDPARFRLEAVTGRTITEQGVSEAGEKLVLYPAKSTPIARRTGLYADNLVALINGPREPGRPVIAIVDLDFAFGEAVPHVIAQPPIMAYGLLSSYPEHVAGLIEGKVPAVVYETSRIPFWAHRPLAGERGVARSDKAAPLPLAHELLSGYYEQTVVVPRGQTLLIGPGQTLEFGKDAGLVVYGTLRIAGSKAHPVILKARGDSWQGVLVVGEGNGSPQHTIEWATFEGARPGPLAGVKKLGGLEFVRAAVSIRDVTVQRAAGSGDAINFYHSWFDVQRLLVDHPPGDAIDSDWSYGEIVDSQLIHCGDDCIDLSGTYAVVRGTRIDTGRDKGVSVGEGSVLVASGNDIAATNYGIAIKDSSQAIGEHNAIRGARAAAIALYVRRPGFGPPTNGLVGNDITGPGPIIRRSYEVTSPDL